MTSSVEVADHNQLNTPSLIICIGETMVALFRASAFWAAAKYMVMQHGGLCGRRPTPSVAIFYTNEYIIMIITMHFWQ